LPLTASASVSIPALTVTRAETTLELGSGQSFALAGLLRHDTTQDISKVPALGDIPILGQLFRSDQFRRDETELVIIVTPYLVNPVATASLTAAPTDGFVPAHDVSRITTDDTYRQQLPAPQRGPLQPGSKALIGPVGFRLD
jgi:pilus assembly protein CpaC